MSLREVVPNTYISGEILAICKNEIFCIVHNCIYEQYDVTNMLNFVCSRGFVVCITNILRVI